MNSRLPRLRPELREEHLFLLLSLLIGIFAGLAVVSFRVAIEWSRLTLLGPALQPAYPRIVIVPALAGLVVGAIVQFLVPAARGSGVHQTKAAVYVYDGYIPFRTVLTKFVTCALAIGGGHSLGPEDPSLQIGAGLASLFGRALKLSRDNLRLIAPIGAAAGLAAAFNSPVTAVLFVVEEVVGTWRAGVLGAIVLAAVSAVVVEQWFLGDAPLFRVPAYHLAHPQELVAYAALGVAGGFAALAFTKLVLWLRPRLRRTPVAVRLAQPLAAGALIGVLGLWWPQVMGAGYEYIDEAMHDQYGWALLATLAVVKIAATSLSFSTGVPGGLFAPTLFIGAMLGGAVCGVERLWFPGVAGPDRRVRARGDGGALRGHPARPDDLRVHDGRGQRQLLDRAARHDRQQHRVRDLAPVPADADLRGALAAGRSRAALDGRGARTACAARRGCHAPGHDPARGRRDDRRRTRPHRRRDRRDPARVAWRRVGGGHRRGPRPAR